MKPIFYNYKPISNLKTSRLANILYWATEVKSLGMIPGLKFLLDENCESEYTGKNSVTVKRFFASMGLREQGQTDKFILGMATRQGYTVVTRDKKFVIHAYDEGIPIIYTLDGSLFYLVEKPVGF